MKVRTDVPIPVPVAGEVLVEVGACCCNNSDIWLREGAYGREEIHAAQAAFRNNQTAGNIVIPSSRLTAMNNDRATQTSPPSGSALRHERVASPEP